MSKLFRRRTSLVFPALLALSLVVFNKIDIGNTDHQHSLWFAVLGIVFSGYQILMLENYSDLLERRKLTFTDFIKRASKDGFSMRLELTFIFFSGGAVLFPLTSAGFLLYDSHPVMTKVMGIALLPLLLVFEWQSLGLEKHDRQIEAHKSAESVGQQSGDH